MRTRIIVLGFLFLAQQIPSSMRALAVAQGSQNQPPLDLTGTWQTKEGEKVKEVEIDHLRSSGLVIATFAVPTQGDCPNGDDSDKYHRAKFIEGTLSGRTISGTMWRCTESKPLLEGCKLDPVFTTTFKTTLVSNNRIDGMRRSQYWDLANSSGPCKYTRDPSRDQDMPFTLVRKTPNYCPDTDTIEKYNQVAERAAKFTEAASKYVKDGQIGNALDESQKALRGISNVLSVYIKVGKKCTEIHDSLSVLEQFEAAIDQINNAGCDSRALAGGFDNLFQSAGKLGKKFVKLPELQPMFEILSQNQNFFTKVSGALDPEQRWADQFAGVEGYVPNCVT